MRLSVKTSAVRTRRQIAGLQPRGEQEEEDFEDLYQSVRYDEDEMQ